MGITAATRDIFDAFYDDDKMKMLYHGHSYTANPTICAAALASLDLLLQDSCTQNRKRIINAHAAFAASVAHHPLVNDIRQTGTIIALEIATETPAYHTTLRDVMYRFFLSKNIIMRPLGNIIYILPPYCISDEELQYIYSAIKELLGSL